MQLPLSSFDQQFFQLQNKYRTNPKALVPVLQDIMNHIDENGVLVKEGEPRMKLIEGKPAYKEAIDFLNKQAPVKALKLSEGMSRACMDHVLDQGPKGGFGHKSTDGTSPWARLAKYGKAVGEQAESISYGQKTPLKAVIQLVVDEGVENRGHRTNFFKPRMGATGIASGTHAQFGYMTCVDYAK